MKFVFEIWVVIQLSELNQKQKIDLKNLEEIKKFLVRNQNKVVGEILGWNII